MNNESDDKIAELYKTQISLTEWLANIGHTKTTQIRAEDNDKTERLRAINRIIEIPFDDPIQFASASELTLENPQFAQLLKTKGQQLCALRLIPLDKNLPKLRMRGRTINGAYAWFQQQPIDPKAYRADFRHHAEKSNWATIFVINKYGISGEIIRGGHHQLTQGRIDDKLGPRAFHFDYKTWKMSPRDSAALAEIKRQVEVLHVKSADQRKALTAEFGATFSHNYLNGYFETAQDDENDLEFVDYSRELGDMYDDFLINLEPEPALLQGRGASAGITSGTVKIITSPDDSVTADTVMVCTVTSPDLVGQMQIAAAIVTDQGGILSHAAIVARELGKPCIVGTSSATKILRDGQTVTVDGAKGTVKVIDE